VPAAPVVFRLDLHSTAVVQSISNLLLRGATAAAKRTARTNNTPVRLLRSFLSAFNCFDLSFLGQRLSTSRKQLFQKREGARVPLRVAYQSSSRSLLMYLQSPVGLMFLMPSTLSAEFPSNPVREATGAGGHSEFRRDG